MTQLSPFTSTEMTPLLCQSLRRRYFYTIIFYRSLCFAKHRDLDFFLLLPQTQVKRVTSRPWLPSNLPQIRCLFPEAFTFAWLPCHRGPVTTYILKVTPNLSYRASLQGEILSQTPGRAELTSEDLVKRRQVFHNALLQLVKDQHATFLASLNPPISVEDNRLTAWHRYVSYPT